jgi:hypothetical protein
MGDTVCAECHQGQSESFRRHPMGRSSAAIRAGFENVGVPEPFTVSGLKYEVASARDRVLHRESALDAHGKLLFSQEADVKYAVGSGGQGKSYLIDRDGFLFQSPITWYTQTGMWGLSPGYGEKNLHFDRPITEQCLFCHSNHVSILPNSINHFREPIFDGATIGCERCHGPGELHVTEAKRGGHPEDLDFTIVNPQKLEPPLRDAVCEQCHLQGEVRIPRQGKSPFDYRPGLPLYEFLAVYVRPPELTEGRRAISHVEQVQISRCAQASGGKLGCISCHDPHSVPPSSKRVSFYRERCLRCHQESSCSQAPAERRARNGDSCFECHMPKSESANIAHMAVTDHRVIRRSGYSPGSPAWLKPQDVPIIHFHQHLMKTQTADERRDLGLAMIEMARRPGSESVRHQIALRAEPFLTSAVGRHPDDLPALEGRGYALTLLSQPRDALAAYEAVLALVPRREVSLEGAARAAAQLGDMQSASRLWQRYVDVTPHRPLGYFEMAQIDATRGDWAGARQWCRQALKRDAAHVPTRTLLGRAYLALGERNLAEAELAVLHVLDANAARDLERAIQLRPKP